MSKIWKEVHMEETREERRARLEHEARMHDVRTVLDALGSLFVVIVMFAAITFAEPIVETII